MDVHYDVAKMSRTVLRVARQEHVHHHHHGEQDAAKAGTNDSMGEHNHQHSGHSMAMAFHFGSTETILFEFWKTDGALGMVLSCLIVFIIALLYEGLKYYRGRLQNCQRRRIEGGDNRPSTRATTSRSGRRISPIFMSQLLAPKIQVPLTEIPMAPAGDSTQPEQKKTKFPWLSLAHLYQTFLHMIQVTLSFMLMLIFMTCNGWLCIAVILGSSLGFFIFNVRYSVRESLTDHCN